MWNVVVFGSGSFLIGVIAAWCDCEILGPSLKKYHNEKIHGHNIDFSDPARIGGVFNPIGYPCYSWRSENSKLWPCLCLIHISNTSIFTIFLQNYVPDKILKMNLTDIFSSNVCSLWRIHIYISKHTIPILLLDTSYTNNCGNMPVGGFLYAIRVQN